MKYIQKHLKNRLYLGITTGCAKRGIISGSRTKLTEQNDYQPRSLKSIGDCEAPAILAAAVYVGHWYARELDTVVDADNRDKYDRVFYEES